MKFKHDRQMTQVAVYAFLVLAAAILFTLLLQQLGAMFAWVGKLIGYIFPVVYGFIIAYLLNPMIHTLDDKLFPRIFPKMKGGVKRGISILVTYLLVITVLALFIALVVPQIVTSLAGIGENVPIYMKSLQTFYLRIMDSLAGIEFLDDSQSSEMIGTLIDSVMSGVESLLGQLGDWLAGDFVGRVWNMASSVTSGVLDLVLGVIISIYFLADREKLFAQLRKVFSAIFKENTVGFLHDLAMETNRTFSGFIMGKIIDSLIIGVLCFIGVSLLRLPYAVLISFIVGVTNVIPYFGPFIGAIPSFVLIFISDANKGPVQSLIFLVFILVLQQFDGNILGPKILGDSTGLSAFWVIFAIMLFNGMLGVVGMFIGVPLFAVLYTFVKRIIAHILRKKGMPTDTRSYASNDSPLIK